MQGLFDRGLDDPYPAKVMSGSWEWAINGVDLGRDLGREYAFPGYQLVYVD